MTIILSACFPDWFELLILTCLFVCLIGNVLVYSFVNIKGIVLHQQK